MLSGMAKIVLTLSAVTWQNVRTPPMKCEEWLQNAVIFPLKYGAKLERKVEKTKSLKSIQEILLLTFCRNASALYRKLRFHAYFQNKIGNGFSIQPKRLDVIQVTQCSIFFLRIFLRK